MTQSIEIWFDFFLFFFFFNDTATTEIYTLSLHDALPIYAWPFEQGHVWRPPRMKLAGRDRKSTRLNSSHQIISYAVFCLKKKIKTKDLSFDLVSVYLTNEKARILKNA